MDAELARIVAGDCRDPFTVLGMHAADGRLVVRTFQPRASRVEVIDAASGSAAAKLERVHESGLFVGAIAGRERPFPYRLSIDSGGRRREIDDAYRFGRVLGELDIYLLAEGTDLRAYEKLGAHVRTMEGVEGTSFAVWAPNARRVSVVGDFNHWDGRVHPMRFLHESGIWEIFVPGVGAGERYKFEIKASTGVVLPLKADPYAMRCESPPDTASIVMGEERYQWGDGAWIEARGRVDLRAAPMAVYEVHLGSWKRHAEGNRYYTYGELADDLIPYVKAMGFTHVELMPVAEHPFDGSWGYQPIGLFAPTSRFGTPDEFRAFVERAHAAGIGVLIDWVPGHFPSDQHGLGFFDGTHLYEHADPRQGVQPDWNTLVYNFDRREVANYLASNALFWLRSYHADGLRVDAVASMLYLDYSRKPGEWVPNVYGGNENLGAIAFLRRTNELVFGEAAGVTTIAEESTSWPMVTAPTTTGGLGFGFKWNMGWMHDTLAYMHVDPIFRRYHQENLTFGLLYAFSENFVLPLSHDEVVHGKGSLIGKMPGDRWQRFANLRLYYGFMYGHPGKKLLFMGAEIAQEREWSHDRGLDWHLLDDPMHQGVARLVADLNALYRGRRALHELDCEPAGFSWIDFRDRDAGIVSFVRRARDPQEHVVVVGNFAPVVHRGYRIGVPSAGRYRELLNTDSSHYGGSNVGNAGTVDAEPVPMHGFPCSVALTLPPLGALFLAKDDAAR
ncbi:MAG TPA: 1,4-alpha-glucan branching protein GlgB [Candidatus Dormibacteraeota bacterium]|nr:1,4-alpha-glucan branching protein GlgB [Candidatus Dormibacteraeota bacterium]